MTSALSERLTELLSVSHKLQESMEADSLVASTRELELWQKARLEQTYQDFRARDDHRDAVSFFSGELYAPANLGARDHQLRRMVPIMVRLLPDSILATVAMALEVQNLSLWLDIETARVLAANDVNIPAMDASTYAQAYRQSAEPEQRERQILLILEVGRALDDIVHIPAIYQTLIMARWPARMAGLSDLQQFLENGFSAFRAMGSAESFLAAIEARETKIMRQILDAEADPFRL